MNVNVNQLTFVDEETLWSMTSDAHNWVVKEKNTVDWNMCRADEVPYERYERAAEPHSIATHLGSLRDFERIYGAGVRWEDVDLGVFSGMMVGPAKRSR